MDEQEPKIHEGEVLPFQGAVQQDGGADSQGHRAEHGYQGHKLWQREQEPPQPTPTGEGRGQARAAGARNPSLGWPRSGRSSKPTMARTRSCPRA